MNKMKLYIFLFLFPAIVSRAQTPQGMGPGQQSQADPIGVVKGIVIDSRTGDPLPYTNIVLNRQRDSTMVTGTIAGNNGSFLLNKIPFGRYYLEVKFIGFEKETIPNLLITPQKYTVDLGSIRVREAAQQLKEVEISAERASIEYKIDRKVIQISENLANQGESVSRALENAPSITVDIDGNVALRGSTNFTVLIDGKPSPLEGSDALKQIPASAVENVEIITNPSAKFDPDGLAGIINIITKKRALDGVSGIANVSVGTGDKYRGDVLFNYKNDNLSYFIGADYNDETRKGNLQRTSLSYLSDTTRYVVSNGSGGHGHNGYTFKGGISYNLNDKNSFSLEGSMGQHGGGSYTNDYFHEYYMPETEDLYYYSKSNDDRKENFYNLTLNYQRTFDRKDHNLVTYLYFQHGSGGSKEYQTQYNTDNNWLINDSDPYRIFSSESSNEIRLRYQADYTKPLGQNGKFESGYQLRYDKEPEDYSFNEWDSSINNWVDNPDFSNSMEFKRNIQALYGIFSNEWQGFGYQIGLRGEYTYRSVKHEMADQPAVINRIDLFPTVHLSKKIGKQDQALASYSRRINRPRGYFLDPFPNYMDTYNLRVGNPKLEPEYVDSYELSYQKGVGKSSFISLEGYYRLTNNAITRVMNVRDDGVRVHTMENLNTEHAMGAELMLNFLITKWFNFNAGINLYNYRLEGNVSDSEVAKSSNNMDFRINTNFRITPTTRFQIQGFYQGPSVTAQGERKEFFLTSAALRQDLLKDKLSATLQVRDIFGTGSFRFINQGTGYYDEFNFKREPHVIRLALSYRINNYKKQNHSRDVENGDNSGDSDAIMNY